MSIDQYGIHIGILYIRFYALIIMLGVVAGIFLSERLAIKKKKDPDFLYGSVIWLFIAGVIGARLWHIFTPPPSMTAVGLTTSYYLSHPLEAIAIWQGGLGIPGAVIAAVLMLYYLARREDESFLGWIDILAPGAALAQAVGRWGNFINHELYGAPTTVPWAITIPAENRLPQYAQFETYHPIFLYESLWMLGTALFLIWLDRQYGKRLKPGDLFLSYLTSYAVIRFMLEFLRLDASLLGAYSTNQLVMGVVFLASAGLLIYRHSAKSLKKRSKK
jgi:phosphatidylglycerol:prolipoprotein diacylglycerol transferase